MNSSPTPEQQAAIEHLGNAVVTARPGSGKTFTLVRMIAQEASDLLSYQGIIAISYTNKASDELEERCDSFGIDRASSFFGTIDKFCISEIISPFISHISGRSADFEIVENGDCAEWSQLAKRPLNDNDVRAFLHESLLSGSIPISAIGPMTLYILDTVPQARIYVSSKYTSVFIDEYQDCGLCQHLIFKRLVSYGLRGVVVGDIDQAIFRFADKSPDHLIELIKKGRISSFQINKESSL
ncbi:UvrD-helicase domain-containing protein [Adlercreutzia sp. ZJ154]|uniref:UvrD-helicase domain-containing protein n=1 Tax=Adlercreutzia sp. ZJ154 TaxID=2709790 RepID=UPI0013ED0D57|nr:UvrD-helicase domain-containing protein [Adlercreutzia sp. ZJ154]